MRTLNEIKHDIALIGLEIVKAKPAVDRYNHLLMMKSDLEQELFRWKISNGEYHSIIELAHDESKVPVEIELVIRDIDDNVSTKVLIDHMRLTNDGCLDYHFDSKHIYRDNTSLDPHDYIYEYNGNKQKIRVLGYLKVEYMGG